MMYSRERAPALQATARTATNDSLSSGALRCCLTDCWSVARLFGGCGVNDGRNPRDLVCRKSTLFRVTSDHLLVRSVVHAIDLVARDVALDPLNLRSQAAQHAARFLRDGLELSGGELASAGNLAFDHELWHAMVLSTSGQRRMRGAPDSTSSTPCCPTERPTTLLGLRVPGERRPSAARRSCPVPGPRPH